MWDNDQINFLIITGQFSHHYLLNSLPFSTHIQNYFFHTPSLSVCLDYIWAPFCPIVLWSNHFIIPLHNFLGSFNPLFCHLHFRICY